MLAKLRIQRAQRLVKQKNSRLEHQTAGYRNPLLLPSGELAYLLLSGTGQADPLQHIVHLALDRISLLPAAAQPEGHVLEDVHHGKQSQILKDKINRAFVRCNALHIDAVKQDSPLVLPVEARYHP